MAERFNRDRAIPKFLKAMGIISFIGAAVLAVLFNVMRVSTVQAKYEEYLIFLRDFEASVAALENKWLIIIVIFLLYILRSLSAVIPYAVIYITSAMVFPPRQSFLINLIGMAFTAAIWSVIALAVSIWIPDKLLVVAIPAAIFYIWNADISFYVFGVPLPSPASLFNDGLSVQKAVITLIMYAVAFAVSAGGFYMGCRRRCQHV